MEWGTGRLGSCVGKVLIANKDLQVIIQHNLATFHVPALAGKRSVGKLYLVFCSYLVLVGLTLALGIACAEKWGAKCIKMDFETLKLNFNCTEKVSRGDLHIYLKGSCKKQYYAGRTRAAPGKNE